MTAGRPRPDTPQRHSTTRRRPCASRPLASSNWQRPPWPRSRYSLPHRVQRHATTFTERSPKDVSGVILQCQDRDLTITAGAFETLLHVTVDGQGVVHVDGTGVPKNVTLQDGSHDTFTMSGASSFSGIFTNAEAGAEPIELTGSERNRGTEPI